MSTSESLDVSYDKDYGVDVELFSEEEVIGRLSLAVMTYREEIRKLNKAIERKNRRIKGLVNTINGMERAGFVKQRKTGND